jgi:hypothetical protein
VFPLLFFFQLKVRLQFISALLSCGPHHPRHSFCHLFPLRFFDDKLFSSLIRKPVVLEFPIPIWSHLPFRGDPSPSLQPVQRRVKRAVLHLEKIIRGPLNLFADLVAVGRTIKKGSQDQHVKGALKKVRAFRSLFSHGRHSTINWTQW